MRFSLKCLIAVTTYAAVVMGSFVAMAGNAPKQLPGTLTVILAASALLATFLILWPRKV